MTTKGNACGNCGKTLVTDECGFCGWKRGTAKDKPAGTDYRCAHHENGERCPRHGTFSPKGDGRWYCRDHDDRTKYTPARPSNDWRDQLINETLRKHGRVA